MKKKAFDCVEMKRAAQEKIRQKVKGMTREQEVEFFRSGSEEFERRIRAAKEARVRRA